ncbi:leucine-rich repeat protein [uncultured Neglectibacter sp.]|uniref:leucine-rich repeat protein n=1 Tax=uncultured Neglectibacter sp. TaxID=1924108 RepID=UPI0034DE0E11
MNRMKKSKVLRLASLLLALLLAAAALPMDAFAVDTLVYQVGDRSFLALNRLTGALENAVNITGDLTIPSSIQNVAVTSIADRAFSGCIEMTSVTVPSSVRTIGDEAFASLTSLQSVTIKEGATRLGKNAFRYCYALTDVSLPSTLTSIDSSAFSACLALRSITIPSNVTSLGSNCFNGCKNLSSVTMSDNISSIGDYAFGGCTSLTSITLPASLRALPTALFNGCSSLSQVEMSNQVLYVGKSAFSGCSSLERLVLPEGVEKVYEGAFDGCRNLKYISMPDSINGIAFDSFDDCENVTFYVNAGSYSQVFASANGIAFVLGQVPDDPNHGNNGNYPPTPFYDVQNHWAKSYIEWAYAMGYFKGTGSNTFSPDVSMNRGMLVALLYRMEGSPAVGSSSFTDVPAKEYYADAVAWAEDAKIATGTGGGKFSPNQKISREQFATMLYRYAQYKGKDTSTRGDLSQFKDNASVSGFAGAAMAWAVGTGVLTGKSNGNLDPLGRATRAEGSAMLQRFTDLK